MTPTQTKALIELQRNGHAVVVYTPEELEGADPTRVEDRLIELGWDVIECLAEEKTE